MSFQSLGPTMIDEGEDAAEHSKRMNDWAKRVRAEADERVRQSANREATMRETLGRTQAECTRLTMVKQEQAEKLRDHEARESKFIARIAELEDQVSAALEALRLSEQQLYEARKQISQAGPQSRSDADLARVAESLGIGPGYPVGAILDEIRALKSALFTAQAQIETRPVFMVRESARFTEDEFATLKRAVDTWGPDAQLGMLSEESLELALAVRRFQRKRDGAWANLAEEVADVEIMLGQVLMIMRALGYEQFGEQVMTYREAKLERLRERLDQYPPVHTGFRCKT